MNIGRKGALALILTVIVEILAVIFIVNGFFQDELILGLRKITFCFTGSDKVVFCFSSLIYLASINLIVLYGYKIRSQPNKSIKLVNSIVFILMASFFGSMAGLITALILGAKSCT